jgi:hypothetical protein
MMKASIPTNIGGGGFVVDEMIEDARNAANQSTWDP